ncbi:MAG: YgaP family membrane protein [Ferrimicrobium sp.]
MYKESEGTSTSQWPVERATNLLAGSIVLFSLGMARVHSNRWRFLTAFVGTNLLMNAAIGWCPASLALRRLGLPTAAQCARR